MAEEPLPNPCTNEMAAALIRKMAKNLIAFTHNPLQTLEETGTKQYQEIVKKVLLDRTDSIQSPIKKNSLALVKRPCTTEGQIKAR